MICIHKDLTYTLTKTNRKTLSIYVEPEGNVSVRAPHDITQKQLDAIIDLKSYWIYKSKAELQELNRARVTRQISNGEGFLYLGKSYRLTIKKDLTKPLMLTEKYFQLREDKTDKARELFLQFYRDNGKKHISERVELFQKKLGVNPKTIRVMDLKNRWASRGKSGLNFHWKLMLAPITVIDYIIVHELAHLKKQGHSPEFWELVRSVLPNYMEQKNWLRTNGANLDI